MRNFKKVILAGGIAVSAYSGTALAQETAPTTPADGSTPATPADRSAPATPVNASAPAAKPGQGLDDIVVTATKTGVTQVQKTGMAISVFSADKLNAAGAVNVKDLVTLTPNLSVAQNNASAQIYIRGIGSNNVNNGSDPDVTVQVDGVYLGRPYAEFTDFVDVDRIEVLRGPQGTLYGRNAVGGTLNVISRLPTDDFQAKVQVTGGTYDLAQLQAYVSGPIVPGVLQVSVTGNYIRHDAYVDNVVPGSQNVGNADRGGGRIQIRFEPTSNLEFITRADYNKANELYDANDHILAPVSYAPLANSTLGDYSKVALDQPNMMNTEMWGVSEEINLRLSDTLKLKSLTAYRGESFYTLSDKDATEIPVATSTQSDTARDFSQEFDLNLNLPRFQGVAGLYYFHENEQTLVQSYTPPGIATSASKASITTTLPDSDVRSEAAFAQGTYHLTDTLGFTGGVRYTQDRKGLDLQYTKTSLDPATLDALLGSFQATTAPEFHAWTPKFEADWQVTPAVLLYGSATRGYKSGGTNYAATSVATLSFAPETIWSYEGGIKSEWFDRRLRVNVTGFQYDYKDLQVSSLIAPGVASISNAASARVRGLEFETTAKPLPNVLLTANYSLLDARYLSFPEASVPAGLAPFLAGPNYNAAAGTYDASGNQMNSAPKSSFSGSAELDHSIGSGKAFLRADYYWQARTYYDPSNALIMSQKPYSLVNLAVGYTAKNAGWGVQLLAKNVTNTQYLITIVANGVVPAGNAGAPRTLAIQFTKNW